MRRTVPLVGLIVLLVSVAVVPASGSRRSADSGTVVKAVFNKHLKKLILVNARGLTLYGWTQDFGDKPTCYNDPTYHCSKAWPPLITSGKPHAGPGVKSSLLGMVKRKDGTEQVTYKGWPLYTDAGGISFGLHADKKPGDLNGIGFAGLWFVVEPSGKTDMS
jgi:predicted lipoprotein with Yx(FWY)xxD motif